MVDNLGEDSIAVISTIAKLDIMQENGYTEVDKDRLLDKLNRTEQLEDK